jgi:hypothetical protein
MNQATAQIGGSSIAASSTVDYIVSTNPSLTQKLPLNGAAVHVSPLGPLDSSWNGLMWSAYVPADGVIKIRVSNVTTSPITPVSQGFTVFVVAGS